MPDDLLRHIAACRNWHPPGTRQRLWLGSGAVGWVTPETAAEIGTAETGTFFPDAASFEAMAEGLARAGRVRWRNEAFPVRAGPDGPELARIDRGSLPRLGVWSEGVHVNGLVRRGDGPWLWVAERAANKALDPGKLDHLVAGGVPAGLTPIETLIKEAAEEADIPAARARRSREMGRITYAMERPEGLRRDRLHCYDLWLPEEFVPRPADGEVAGFALRPASAVLERLRGTDDFKFNVALVLIDLFLRLGLIDPASAEGRALRAGLDEPVPP
ncbi:MAG TPA: NUDIX domain-containing protein [Acetobacteraceae bacterium]|nr:NUDIX domain-containing protein [Acetobacteraceae bacterium]